MFKSFDDLLKNKPVIMDGAMGTVLIQRGCPPDYCLEQFALNHPSLLSRIYHEYIDSGADIITTATFGANPYRLKPHGLSDETENINRLLATLTKKIAGDNSILLAGDIGPSGITVTASNSDDLTSAYKYQVKARHFSCYLK